MLHKHCLAASMLIRKTTCCQISAWHCATPQLGDSLSAFTPLVCFLQAVLFYLLYSSCTPLLASVNFVLIRSVCSKATN